jgi:hypothetical protein
MFCQPHNIKRLKNPYSWTVTVKWSSSSILGTVIPVFVFQNSEQRPKTICGSQGRAFNLSDIQEHKTKMKIRFSVGPPYINKQDRQCTHNVILGCIPITTVAMEKQ